jgi:hypothetical protein
MHITFNQIYYDCPTLAQFIDRTSTLMAHDKAHVEFYDEAAGVALQDRYSTLRIEISCSLPGVQLLYAVKVCNSYLPPPSMVEDLYIEHLYSQLVWKNDAFENAPWLGLLLPFTAVKNLYLSKEFAPDIAAALQGLVGARITEVLPSLQNIFIEGLESSGPFQEKIGQFVAARRLSGHPIAISVWDEATT